MADPRIDMIDCASNLAEGGPTQRLRQHRSKVVGATRGSWEALFSPALLGLTPAERFLVAIYACNLTPAPELAQRYRERNWADGIDDALMQLIEGAVRDDAALRTAATARQAALLRFTRILVDSPKDGDHAALAELTQAGLSTPGIVALAQLIGFITYQTRIVSALGALEMLNASDAGSAGEA